MERYLSLFIIFLATLAGHAQQPQGLPVMKLTMEGNVVGSPDYLPGRMVLTATDGSEVSLAAKFRTRGATAKQYTMKPALNLKLRTDDYSASRDSSLLGLRSCSSWILDAMAVDPIAMRNRVCFDLWNAHSRLPYATEFGGRSGTVGQFVELWMNGTYYGIYCLTDKVNRKLLDLKKVKEEADGTFQVRGVLYKHGTQDIAVQNERCYSEDFSACVVGWHNAWELSEPDEFACQEAWLPLLDAYDNGKELAYVSQYFDLQNLAEYQVFIMALGIKDNWGNKNRYFSIRNVQKDITSPIADDAARRRFIISPWDLDSSFGGYEGHYSEFTPEQIMKNCPYPFSTLAGNADYRRLLAEAWGKARSGALSIESVEARLDHYAQLFTTTGAWQRMTDAFSERKYKPCHATDLAAELERHKEWYRRSFADLDRYFGIVEGIAPIATTAVAANEAPAAPAAAKVLTTDGQVVIERTDQPATLTLSGQYN